MMSFMKTVEKILAILEDRRLSMSALEAMAGLPRGRVQKWGTGQGEPSLSAAWRISQALGVPLEWLANDRAGMPVPSLEENVGADESAVLVAYRAFGLDAEEAVRFLSLGARTKSISPFQAGLDDKKPMPPEEDDEQERRRRPG